MREDILARGEDPSLFPILNSKPDLYTDLLWIWEGFIILSSSRQIGMNGPQPILMSEISAYAQYAEISDLTDRDDFLHHVQKLDLVFMADWQVKHPAKTTPGSGLGML